MTRVYDTAFRLLLAPLTLSACFAATTLAQTPSPSPTPSPTPSSTPDAAKTPDNAETKQEQANPFAPEAAKPLPTGMTGSDVNDPRAKLTPGVYDAGETAVGSRSAAACR